MIKEIVNCLCNNQLKGGATTTEILDIISRDKEQWKQAFSKYHSLPKNEIMSKLNDLSGGALEEDDEGLLTNKKKDPYDISKGKPIDEYTILNIIKFLETETGKYYQGKTRMGLPYFVNKKLFEYDPYETAFERNYDKYRDYQKKIIENWTVSLQELLILYYGVGTGKTIIATTMAEEYTRLIKNSYVYFVLPASLVFNTIGLMFKYGIDPTIKREGNYIYNFISYQQALRSDYNFKRNSLLIIDEIHNLRNFTTNAKTRKPEGSILSVQIEHFSKMALRKVFLTGTLFVNSPRDIDSIIALGYNRPPLLNYDENRWNEIMGDNKEFKNYFQGLISFYRIGGENLKLMPRVKYHFEPIFTTDKSKIEIPKKDVFLLETRLLGTKDKVRWTIDFINKHKKEKTLIYAQFLDAQIALLVEEMKKDKSLKFGLISGELTPKKKQLFIEAYNTNKINILIFSLAIKEGISFKETNNFIVFTPYWNYAITEQVIARAIRLDSHKDGDKSLVNVYFPFMNSLETDLTKEDMDKAIIPFVKKANDIMNNIGIKNIIFEKERKSEFVGTSPADKYFNVPLDLQRQRDLDMYYRMFDKMSEINLFEKRLLALPKFEDVNNLENNEFSKLYNQGLLEYQNTNGSLPSNQIMKELKKDIYDKLYDKYLKKIGKLYKRYDNEAINNFIYTDETGTSPEDQEEDLESRVRNALVNNKDIKDIFQELGIDRDYIVKYQAFFTPEIVVDKLIEISGIEDDERENIKVLEPTAGIGNIAYKLASCDNSYNLLIDANEYNKIFYLIGKYNLEDNINTINWTNIDFLNFVSRYKYDYIIGNPPYSLKTNDGIKDDIDFIAHAYDLLEDEGKLTFIVSNKFTFREQNKYKAFRDALDKIKEYNRDYVYTEEYKKGFTKQKIKGMDTGVQMVIIRLVKVPNFSINLYPKKKDKKERKKIEVELPVLDAPPVIPEEPVIKPSKKLSKKLKDCKEDQIRNPTTNRCVKKTGAIGKKLLNQKK